MFEKKDFIIFLTLLILIKINNINATENSIDDTEETLINDAKETLINDAKEILTDIDKETFDNVKVLKYMYENLII